MFTRLTCRWSSRQGELMRTEISAKFRREGVAAELDAAGLRLTNWWTDPNERFRVVARGAAADSLGG